VACGRVVFRSLQLPLLEGVVGNAHAVACVLGMAFSHQETRRLWLVACIFAETDLWGDRLGPWSPPNLE
jgi:hypothetical protein